MATSNHEPAPGAGFFIPVSATGRLGRSAPFALGGRGLPSGVLPAEQRSVIAAIALGGNVGDRRAHLEAGVKGLERLPGTQLIAVSPFIETAPVGDTDQGAYFNGAAVIRTALSPRELLASLQAIERAQGRDRARERRWGPRTLDLDLLLWGDVVLDEPGLTIPHPRMHEREFVLRPLAQIAPDILVPHRGRVADLLAEITGRESGRTPGELRT